MVRKLRYRRQLSQAELAAKCQLLGWNISRDIVAAIEGRVRRVTDIEIVGLAVALQTSEKQLLPSQKEALKALSASS